MFTGGVAFRGRGIHSLIRSGVALAIIASMAGCATAPPKSDEVAYAAYKEANDPLEPMNRAIFEFNVGLDKAILRPTAIAYREVLPLTARKSVTDFLDNLETPVVLLNDVLQGKPNRAGITLSRFAINTTVGFFGFFDPAEDMGLERHDEDFAQTLGYWGVPEGPYLMLPLLGPLPPRDTVGFIVDRLTDPINYALRDELLLDGAIFATDLIDVRHQVIDEVDELERTSVDYYAAVRSLYRQSVNAEIQDGQPDLDELPNFDFPEDEELTPEDAAVDIPSPESSKPAMDAPSDQDSEQDGDDAGGEPENEIKELPDGGMV